MFSRIRHIHFIGIGGVGMSGIAEVLLNLGYMVSGSDIKKGPIVSRLAGLGADIFIGHSRKNVGSAHVVVVSSAIEKNNPEIREALSRKIPVIPRAEMLAELMRLKYAVAISGTHGKTTTTAMVALVLAQGGLDPTILIGGRLKNFESGARLGKGEYLVAEADESDGSFLKLSPTIAVLTNIDTDHLDFYKDIDEIKETFLRFINKTPFYGSSFICIDDKNVRSIEDRIDRKYYTYGIKKEAMIMARDIRLKQDGFLYSLYHSGKRLGRIRLRVRGEHNIYNSLAAAGVGLELGLTPKEIKDGLEVFGGVERRLEIKGNWQDVTVIDDYGHHPTEVAVTINAVRNSWPSSRIIVVFQPHRYSRTLALAREFGRSFSQADRVFIMDIYPAGEKPLKGVTSKLILDSFPKGARVEYIRNRRELMRRIRVTAKPGDIVLTLGAGDVYKIGEQLLEES